MTFTYKPKDSTPGKTINVLCWNCKEAYELAEGANTDSLPCRNCQGNMQRHGWAFIGTASIIKNGLED